VVRPGDRDGGRRMVMSRRDPVLFIDASAGASGDMILGALVDLGVPLARIRRAMRFPARRTCAGCVRPNSPTCST